MENKEMVTQLIHMLTAACADNQWETARFMLKQLDTYGFHYMTQDNHAVFKLNDTIYRVPLEEKKEEKENIPDLDDFWSTNTVKSGTLSEQPVSDNPDNPWDMPVSEEAADEPEADMDVDSVFGKMFGDSVEKDVWGERVKTNAGVDDELEALLKSLDAETDTKTDDMDNGVLPETPEKIPEKKEEMLSCEPVFVDFSRKDADAAPERTPGHKFIREKDESDKPTGFMPPLTGDITANTEIALSDCVYSIFLANIYEESSILKQKIFFMVAPFEVSEDTPSANIFLYAYMDGKNYSSNSLKNPNKNSLYCQIGPYEFFIRGYVKEGKWQAEIKLAGNSLTRHDIFEITNEKHFSPESLGKTNGHIRFRYKGFVNHKDMESLGCVNIFPIDPNTRDFVMIRCIEDFMDVFYSTDEKKVMELQTMEGVKEVRPVCDEYGICRAVITDKPKEEEEAMIK